VAVIEMKTKTEAKTNAPKLSSGDVSSLDVTNVLNRILWVGIEQTPRSEWEPD
jgi:hypothetical protein